MSIDDACDGCFLRVDNRGLCFFANATGLFICCFFYHLYPLAIFAPELFELLPEKTLVGFLVRPHPKKGDWFIGRSLSKVTWDFSTKVLGCWEVLNQVRLTCVHSKSYNSTRLWVDMIQFTEVLGSSLSLSLFFTFPQTQAKHWYILTSNFPCCQTWLNTVNQGPFVLLNKKDMIISPHISPHLLKGTDLKRLYTIYVERKP